MAFKATYNLIVLVTKNYAMNYDDKPIWEHLVSQGSQEFYENIMKKDDIIIMGRKTFETLPEKSQPFMNRMNLVMSRSYPKYMHFNREKVQFSDPWLMEHMIMPKLEKDTTFWIVGGREMFDIFHKQCQGIYMVVLDKSAKNVQNSFNNIPPYFELVSYSSPKWSVSMQCSYRTLTYQKNEASVCLKHESQYLEQLQTLLSYGNERIDRTSVGTFSIFGAQHRYDVSKYLPLLTTKFVPIGIIVKELLWFMRGETDSKILEKQAVNIWKGNTSREFLDKRGLHNLPEGDIGAGYGLQWRHFGADYVDCKSDYTGQGIDQLKGVLEMLKNDPFSRRIIISAWNPAALDKMALPPCHMMCQFYVEEDATSGDRFLSCQLYQRSSDYFLAGNYNLVSYTILLYILAKKTGYKPKDMIHTFGDIHCYKSHVEQAKLQLSRSPRTQPILEVSDKVKDKEFEDITPEDFTLIGYFPQPAIRAEMSV